MSEISEQDARKAAIDIVDGHYGESNEDLDQWHEDIRTCASWIVQELSRRDAEQAARQQPITPKWCLANGAAFSASWYWFDEGVSIRPIAGGTWLVAVSGQMLNWSAECVGQVEDLRKALRGGV